MSTLSESRRRHAFAALVELQDRGLPVPRTRRSIAWRFDISVSDVLHIEREGLDEHWPPLPAPLPRQP